MTDDGTVLHRDQRDLRRHLAREPRLVLALEGDAVDGRDRLGVIARGGPDHRRMIAQ
ncbi:MAG TPA: hypothetical protein VLN26_17125 [Gaiellaceae bacterium]|nr:hypothetical protein [Gaiellaceae bacterium]